MFYIANIITFSAFSDLLWEYTLIVRYNLNIFQPPRVNHFDIGTLLFGGYSSANVVHMYGHANTKTVI